LHSTYKSNESDFSFGKSTWCATPIPTHTPVAQHLVESDRDMFLKITSTSDIF